MKMKVLVSVCLICVFFASGSLAVQPFNDTFGVGLSSESLTQLLNDVILPVVDDLVLAVGNALPTNCCYANVEVRDSRLYLENLTIPPESVISTGTVQTGSRGVFVDVNVDFNVTFYLHLCVETFGHCDTLFFCKGFSNLGMSTTTRLLLDLKASPTGEPIITVQDFFFQLAIPEKVGLCDLVDILLDTLVPLINDGINIVGPGLINAELAAFTSGLGQTISLNRPFDLQWAVTNSSASTTTGASIMMAIQVLESNFGDKVGPFTTTYQFPNALNVLEGGSAIALEFSDVILNNIFYSYYSLKNYQIQTKSDGFDVTIELTSSPVLSFTNLTGLESASLVLTTKIILKKDLLRITAHATITTHFEVVISPSGQLTLQLDPNDFIVFIDSTVPPVTNATKTLIQNSIEDAWASSIPSVNEVLEENAIQLPQIANFNNPYIEYGNGYAALGFDTAQQMMLTRDGDDVFISKFTHSFTGPIGGRLVEPSSNCPDLSVIGASETECETPKE